MPTLGERFRAAREARGLSLSDVADQIRIRSVYLAAIEEEHWSTIGAPVYIRGFLRTYARFLGLDPEEVVSDFGRSTRQDGMAASEPEQRATAPQHGSRAGTPWARSRGSLLVWTASVVAVLLVAFVVYNELTMREQVSAPQVGALAQASASPAAQASDLAPSVQTAMPGASASPSAGPSPGSDSLALVVSAPSWLRVTVDGSVSMEGTFPAGTTKTFYGRNAIVRIGNAGGVDVYVDGKNIGKLGKSGDVVQKAFTL